jgi:hypothetical protein
MESSPKVDVTEKKKDFLSKTVKVLKAFADLFSLKALDECVCIDKIILF